MLSRRGHKRKPPRGTRDGWPESDPPSCDHLCLALRPALLKGLLPAALEDNELEHLRLRVDSPPRVSKYETLGTSRGGASNGHGIGPSPEVLDHTAEWPVLGRGGVDAPPGRLLVLVHC